MNCYDWDRYYQFPAIGFTVGAEGTCTDAYIEWEGGTTHRSDQVDEQVLNDVQEHLPDNAQLIG